MQSRDFAVQTYLRAGKNLANRAKMHICCGNLDEGLALLRLAIEQLDRAESPECQILPFPKTSHLELV